MRSATMTGGDGALRDRAGPVMPIRRTARLVRRAPPRDDRADSVPTSANHLLLHLGSAIDGRTMRHAGYEGSQRKRKRIEEVLGWMKSAADFRKTRHRGTARVGWMSTLNVAAYNQIRLPKLRAIPLDTGQHAPAALQPHSLHYRDGRYPNLAFDANTNGDSNYTNLPKYRPLPSLVSRWIECDQDRP
jgi:hypothetical protein